MTRVSPEDICKVLDEYGIQYLHGRVAGFVYFISDGEYVKIGKGLPNARIKQMQTGNARELTVLFTIPVGQHMSGAAEYLMHQLFKPWHVRREWFDILKVIDVEEFADWFGKECEVF